MRTVYIITWYTDGCEDIEEFDVVGAYIDEEYATRILKKLERIDRLSSRPYRTYELHITKLCHNL